MILAVTVDGSAPALGQWSFREPSSNTADFEAVRRRNVELTQDTIYFPQTQNKLFVIDRFYINNDCFTYIGARQRRGTTGRGLGASGAGIWLKNSSVDGEIAVALIDLAFSSIWQIYEEKFRPDRIDMDALKAESFPKLPRIFSIGTEHTKPLVLKAGLGSEGKRSYCSIDASNVLDPNELHKALTFVQKTENLGHFNRVLISDDLDILNAIKHAQQRFTFAALAKEAENFQPVQEPISTHPDLTTVFLSNKSIANSDLRQYIKEIIYDQINNIKYEINNYNEKESMHRFSKPSKVKKYLFRSLWLVPLVAISAFTGAMTTMLTWESLHGSSVVEPDSHGTAGPPVPRLAESPPSFQSPPPSTPQQADGNIPGTANDSLTKCDIILVKHNVDDLMKTLGTMNSPPKQIVDAKLIVDAIQKNLNKLLARSPLAGGDAVCEGTGSH